MPETKKCKACQSDINSKAKRCPECQQDLRSWFRRHPIISFFLTLLLLGFILSSIGKSDSPSQKESATNSKNSQHSANKEFQKVMNLSTNSNKNSETFYLEGGKQKLKYKTSGEYIICTIYLLEEGTDLQTDGGIPVVMTSKAEEDETILRKKAGEYYISVNTNQDCEVELYEER